MIVSLLGWLNGIDFVFIAQDAGRRQMVPAARVPMDWRMMGPPGDTAAEHATRTRRTYMEVSGDGRLRRDRRGGTLTRNGGGSAATGAARCSWNSIKGARVLGAGGEMAVSRKTFETQVLVLLGPLQGVARRLTGNDTDAEDLVAETIARAWRALETLESEAAFRAWLFRILNNTFISEIRRAAARPQTESMHEEETVEEEAEFSLFEQMHQPFLLWFSNPEQEFLDKLLREDLDRALMTLPETYRIVVILSDLEEFNYAEIARMLDIPIGTVRSRLARGRSALQKLLWQQAQERGIKGARPAGPACDDRGPAASAGSNARGGMQDKKDGVP
jgi:RNA polymerase sigma-70 factor (ECF subfamily)